MNCPPWIVAVIIVGSPYIAVAQPAFSTVPTQTVYEYQLNYQLPWQRYYGGPGLSLGGTMPTQGAIGFSTLNGLPFPAPLGAGVYINPNGGFLPGLPGMIPPLPMDVPALGRVDPGPIGLEGAPRAPHRHVNATRPVQSPPGARRLSVEQQRLGDEKLRQHLWPQAYVHYRNSADLAPERPEAHFRLAVTFAAMKQFASAIREFKRSLDLDPTLPQSGETFSTLFGPENNALQKIMPPVAGWVQEDLKDVNRLFLLGLILHFNDDPRGSEILETAARTPGANEYIAYFLNPASTRQPDRTRIRPHFERQPGNTGTEVQPDDIPPPPAPIPERLEDAPGPAPQPLIDGFEPEPPAP